MTSFSPTLNPKALIECHTSARDSRIWVRVGGDFVEISSVVARADLACDVNGASSLTLLIPYAATGAPPETSAA